MEFKKLISTALIIFSISTTYGLERFTVDGARKVRSEEFKEKINILCITEDSLGFSWENNNWTRKSFKTQNFIIKRPEIPGETNFGCIPSELSYDRDDYNVYGEGEGEVYTKDVCWSLKNLDLDVDINFTFLCSEFWIKNGSKIVLSKLVCSKSFGESKLILKVDGLFQYSFFHGDVEEKSVLKDSLSLDVGKCSKL